MSSIAFRPLPGIDLFNPHANDADGLEMARKYGAGRRADVGLPRATSNQPAFAAGRGRPAGEFIASASRFGGIVAASFAGCGGGLFF
jgi:hypothetical protein